jgi:UPF0716 protein FxsA
MRYLFLLFIAMPIIEMWLLISVGTEIGALATIGLVLLTALIGVQLLREQGFNTLWRGRRKLEEGELPAQEIIEGIILAVSGALLLTPGFVTDIIGFAGLIPPIRVLFVKQMLRRMVVIDLQGNQFRPGAQSNKSSVDGIIEGESWEEKDGIDKPDR